MLNPRTVKAHLGNLTVIKTVRIIDNAHVAITLKNPYRQLPQALAGIQAGIVAPKSISRSPLTPPQLVRLVGTGPHVVKDRVIGRHVHIVRNESYCGPKPTYAEQLCQVVPEAATREAMLLAGRAEVATVPVQDLPALVSHSGFRVILRGQSDAVVTSSRVSGAYALPDGQLVTAEAVPA
jgi:peptide/nickel transport system substrate-binding protein